MSLSVAIVGSGPAGFYAADALIKSGRDCRIDVIERLPSPFGLIRYGVAPDHQSIKKVANSFGRTALESQVRYFGNVEVGRDVSLDELRGRYDAVVLAVGAPSDRSLGVPGEDKAGVIGSAAFVGWYNAHPDLLDLKPDLDVSAVVIIGNGNVAIDVARVLVKTPAEMAASDLPDYAAQAIRASPLKEVYMFGRRGPVEAKFTNVELREMGRLEACAPQVDAEQLPDSVGDLPERERRVKDKNLATLREFASRQAGDEPKRVHFQFYAAPVEVLGQDRVEGLRLERTHLVDGRAVGRGEFFEVRCGLVVSAIGTRSVAIEGAPFDERRGLVINENGRLAEGLYAVGWVMRGPTGVIGTNKPDGIAAAGHILEDLHEGVKPGREALEKLLGQRDVRWVGYEDWLKIDAAEVAAASPGAPRRKFTTVEDMLAVLEEADREQGAA